MNPSTLVTILFSAWGAVTVVLFVISIYRATLSSREDDQIFIDQAERHHQEEQRELLVRMERLRVPIIALTTISAILFLSGVSCWVYQGLKGF